jgi:hypothetical protein
MKHHVITYLKPYSAYNKTRQYQNGPWLAHTHRSQPSPKRFLTPSAFDFRPEFIRVVATPTDYHISSADY